MDGTEKRDPPEGDPENPYTSPGESKAGRGGIVSPGGQQPQPSEDPRKDSGLHDEEATHPIEPGGDDPHPEQHKP